MIEIRLLPTLLFGCSGLSLVLALYALNKPRTILIHIFALFSGAVSVYAFGYGLELLSHDLGEMLLWSMFQYLGISFIPGLILSIAICFTDQHKFISRMRIAIIFAVPVITFVSRLTNPLHHLFYRSAQMHASDYGALLKIDPGPFYLLHTGYTNMVWPLSTYLLIRFLLRAAPVFRTQVWVVLIGSNIQWCGYLIYLAGLGPADLDLNPLLMTLSVPIYAMGLFKLSLFNMVPLAREQVFEEMQDGVIVVNSDLRLVDYNKKGKVLIPELSREAMGRKITGMLDPYPEVRAMFSGGERASGEITMPGKEGLQLCYRLGLNPLFDRKGIQLGAILTFSDVTAQKQLMVQLRKRATIDELTGIYNRAQLKILANVELGRCSRHHRHMAMLMIDLDHFKTINDTWGHHCGDAVLKAFAGAVKENIRAMDVFGRYGGEEFMILMPETLEKTALETARRICLLVADLRVPFEGHSISFTLSIGVSGTWETMDYDRLVQAADNALYTAKREGRNRAVAFPG